MSKPTIALVMWAEGVTSVSSMLWVMMPARCGGVCGNPPAGAAGIVDGIVVVFTKRARGIGLIRGAERAADLRRHAEGKAFIEVRGQADANAIEHFRVSAAHDQSFLRRPGATAMRGAKLFLSHA